VKRRASCFALLVLSSLGEPKLAAAQSDPATNSQDERSCAALTGFNLQALPGGPAIITAAQVLQVPPEGLEHVGQSGYRGTSPRRPSPIHRYCDVTGYAASQNKFELRLPLPSDWNHKFYFNACGGFCGAVNGDLCNFGLERGYASATGNGGHDGALGFDGIWAANAPQLQNDFGWRSNHVVIVIAKAIVAHYYSMPIRYSYMSGNSKGGQAVLMEAQRFPDDFDGLMPSAPVYDYTGRNTIAAAWFAQAFSNGNGGSVLDEEAAQAVHRSVLEHCGAQAGVEEGLVTDPPSCNWTPEMIACRESVDSQCLTPRQVQAIKRLMSPAINSKGIVLYAYPYIPGTETQWSGWNYFGKPGGSSRAPPRLANMDLPAQHAGYLADATIRHHIDALSFNFDRDPPTLSRSRRIYDATSFDLRSFKARGGKILMWHGWSDAAIMATSSIGYFEGVCKFMGGREKTQDFFRLFLLPGVHHGGGGPGLTDFDSFSALEDWVEKGQAPDQLIAGRLKNGEVERTRPIFPYPVMARYSGTGNPMLAESFVPHDPTAR
jgi:Tannase and feruloyl esterase